MNLKSNSFIGIYYRWMFDALPESVCPLFWNVLLSIPLFPFILPVLLIRLQMITGPVRGCGAIVKAAYGITLYAMVFIFIMAGASLYLGEDFVKATLAEQLIAGLKAWGVLVGVIAMGLCVVFLMMQWSEYRDRKRQQWWASLSDEDRAEYYAKIDRARVTPRKSIWKTVRILWDTFMNKYCTKITWK